MPFKGHTRVYPRKLVSDGGPDRPWEGANFCEEGLPGIKSR